VLHDAWARTLFGVRAFAFGAESESARKTGADCRAAELIVIILALFCSKIACAAAGTIGTPNQGKARIA